MWAFCVMLLGGGKVAGFVVSTLECVFLHDLNVDARNSLNANLTTENPWVVAESPIEVS